MINRPLTARVGNVNKAHNVREVWVNFKKQGDENLFKPNFRGGTFFSMNDESLFNM